ncbi:hypothetical protein N8311_02240 [bacterium]|nr:hypothetical protein [bacterium]
MDIPKLVQRILVDNPEFAPNIYEIQTQSDSIKLQKDLGSRDLLSYFSDEKVNVISSEGISDFCALISKNNLNNPLEQTLKDICNIFSPLNIDIKFIAFFREQASAIISKYAEHYGMFSRIDPDFKNKHKFIDVFFKDAPLNNLLRDIYDYEKTLNALKKTGCEFKTFIYEDYGSNKKKIVRELSNFMKIDYIYSKFILSDEKSRVSPKISKYEYYASEFSNDNAKLDSGTNLRTDKVLNYFNQPQFKKYDFPLLKFINYYHLSRLKTKKYIYKTVNTKNYDKKYKLIKFKDHEVHKIKNYYRDSNKVVEKDQKLDLTSNSYYN